VEKDGVPALRLALAYGFRNIQNIVQRMKRGKLAYDYVEIMACPSGCLNGGGQLRPEGSQSAKELLSDVQAVYEAVKRRSPWDSAEVRQLYIDWLGGSDTDLARLHLHTRYHEVEKMNSALTIKW